MCAGETLCCRTLNAEHLSQLQRGSSDFAQGSDDALGVGLGQEGAGVQNAFLSFTCGGRKSREQLVLPLKSKRAGVKLSLVHGPHVKCVLTDARNVML